MAFHTVGKAVVRLEIVGHGISVGEGITFVVVVRQILGELIVHQELEVLRQLLVHGECQAR